MPYKQITQLTAATAITTDDLLVIVDSPASSAQTKKITWANVLAYLANGSNVLTLTNAGLHILDTNASHDLIISPGSDLSADRTFTITTGDADRTLTLGSHVTTTATGTRTLTVALGAADRTVTLGGAITTASDFVISGHAVTLTTTNTTSLMLPTSGTLATLAGTEELDNKTLDSSVGKGTWTASGTWTLPAVTFNDQVTLSGGTVTSSKPLITGTETWNSGAVAFVGLSFAITDTASTEASRLMSITVGGADRIAIVKSCRMVHQYSDPTVSVPGDGNDWVGSGAGAAMDLNAVDGAYHTCIFGGEAGAHNTKGVQNSFFGNRAGHSNTTGNQNTYIGQGAGYENVTTSLNVGIGYHAGLNVSAGTGANTFIGTQCFQAAAGSSATQNVGIGYLAGYTATSCNENVLVGAYAATSLTSGDNNIVIGTRSGYGAAGVNALTTGSGNILIGHEVTGSAASASNETVIGNSSQTSVTFGGVGCSITTTIATFAGRVSLNYTPATSQGYNVMVGASAGNFTMSPSGGAANLASYNTLIGGYAGNAITTGYNNSCLGYAAGTAITTGYINSIFGYQSGFKTNTGYANTFFGRTSGYQNLGGYSNVFVGDSAGYDNTTGNSNVAIGRQAGYNGSTPNATLTSCTLVGNAANSSTDGITNSTAIGNGAQVTASNQVVIGNSSVTATVLRGDVTVGTVKVGSDQVVGARGAAVADATGAGDVVAQLNTLLARLRTHGLIAT